MNFDSTGDSVDVAFLQAAHFLNNLTNPIFSLLERAILCVKSLSSIVFSVMIGC